MSALHLLPALVSVFQAMLTASWQGSIAIVLVLVVRWVLGMHVPARWHYLLWGLVIVRLLVPAFALPRNPASLENIPVVAQPFPRGTLMEINESVSADAAVAVRQDKSADASSQPRAVAPGVAPHPARKPWRWWQWGALVWLVGAMALGSWLATCAVRFRLRLQRESLAVDEEIEAIWLAGCSRWLRRRSPGIVAADWVASPALFGLWRPTLLIPRSSLASFSADDWEHVFAHEIAHLRSRDHWSQLLLMVTLCVHWFNPVVWMGLRRLRVDRELAADEWALRHLESERALAYGETLFKTLVVRPGNFFQPGMVGISEDGAQMKQRLRRITTGLPRRVYGSLAGLAALGALSVVLLGQGVAPKAITPGVATEKPSEKAEEKPATLSLQVPTPATRDVPGEILAAARAGDGKKVGVLLREDAATVRSANQHQALQILDDLVKRRELLAYTVLLDEIRKMPIGKSWYVSDADLASVVKEGRTDFLDAWLARRLDLNRVSQAAKSAEPAMVEWTERRVVEVGKQRADIEALEKAAGDGDMASLRQLVEGGADVNGVGKDDNTPLIRAVFKDRLEAAQFLLDHGAQVDKPRFPGWDYTPLCLTHSVPMAELLRKAGANIHAKLFNRDVSILTYVAAWGPPDLVAWFIKQGLDPKMIGDNDQTLLYYLKNGNTAELLLEAGVDPNHVDDSGQTAIATARSGEVAQKLIDHGAKVKGLPESLLPRMILQSSVGAMEAVLKAGADQDSVTLQETLTRLEGFDPRDVPDKEKMQALLIAHGAKLAPWAEQRQKEVSYKGTVSTVDHAFIDFNEVKVNRFVTSGATTMQDRDYVDTDGTIRISMRPDAVAITFAASADGYATTYAGPFTAPFKEKLEGLHLVLKKGFSATIQTVDEAGKPIAGAKLQGYYPAPPVSYLAEASSDSSGKAVLEHVGEAPLNVRVMAEGYQADEIAGIHLDADRPYHLSLKKAKPLPGVVTSAETGEPIAGASVKLAGVGGKLADNYSDPRTAPLLATTDAQGRFTLTSLNSDCSYFLFVEAPHRGGVLLSEIKAEQGELKVALGPELTVKGKITHIPAGLMHRGIIYMNYFQTFKIGQQMFSNGISVQVKPVDGEGEFSLGPLYASPVGIRVGDKDVTIEAKDLPKSDLVIDLAE